MYSQAGPQATKRVLWLACGLLAWALVIFGRLFFLQVVRHRSFQESARHQQENVVEIPARRGVILDRSGQTLAMSLRVDSACINPQQIPDQDIAVEILSAELNLDPKVLAARIRDAKQAGRGFLWVKRYLSREESERLRSLRLDWVEFRTEHKRYYPKGSLAAHVLGAVNQGEQGYIGLERSLDSELGGKPGTLRVLEDVRHRGISSEVAHQPREGTNVYLTIDERIQYVAERELKKAVTESGSQTGSVVVMNPRNGDILAMASYPTFDPNVPMSPGEDYASRYDHAFGVPFEPGSVFKVITFSAALETTKLRPENIIDCGGGRINLFGRVIHDHHSYGSLTMADVLAKSSNIGTINVGLKVGEKNLLDYVRRFGFGSPTGLPLPAESRGMVRDLKYWIKSSIGSVAIGHEISTTTMQLARACSAIANGGLLVKPRLIVARQVDDGKPEAPPMEQPVRILQPETTITMRQLMEGVVLRGTGKAARVEGYSSGGKTGSAQIFDLQTRHYTHAYNASYMGFAPLANPVLVTVVTINGARQFGGAVAAPVFRAVMTEALRFLDIPKDLPDAEPAKPAAPADVDDLSIASLSEESPPTLEPAALDVPPASAETEEAALVGPKVPDFTGKTKRAVMEDSLAMGMPVDLLGVGVARVQDPPPGSILPAGGRVRVQFAR